MTNRKFSIGLIGYGWWGRQLFNFFNSLKAVNIVAVCDKERMDADLSGTNFYTNMEDFFNKEKMNGVIIATPPALHLKPTQMAAERGIHVFCEKPMAHTVEDCDEMIKVCEKHKVKLFIAFKHRYAGACIFIKENIPKYGKCLWAMYTYPLFKVDDPGWKFKQGQCKGILLENTVHAIDNLRYLVGDDVMRLYAEGDTLMFEGATVPDSAVFTLRFKNGAIAAMGGGSTSERVVIREYLDIHYERAVVHLWGRLDFPTHLRVCMREDESISEHHFEGCEIIPGGSDGVMEEIRHFLKCIANKNERPLATGKDGREAVRIALSVIDSATCGKIIELP